MSSTEFFRALLGNLRAGVRLLGLRPVEAHELTVSFGQLVALLVITLALLAGLDWLTAESGSTFDPYGLSAWACYLLAGLWVCALIARMRSRQADTRALVVAILAMAPLPVIILALVLLLPLSESQSRSVILGSAFVIIAIMRRATSVVFGGATVLSTVLIVLAVAIVPVTLQTQLQLEPRLWYLPADTSGLDASLDAGDAESLLFEQADLIAAAVDKTEPQRAGLVDTWFVGFAGDGAQRVFRNEALFAEEVFAKRFASAGRSVELINDRRDRDTYPLATVSGLRYALQLIGARMNKEEDMLVLLLTSHGSREEGLSVQNGGLPLTSLQPEDLRSALDDAGIKWRVIIVSACYSGIFIEPLRNDSTLVITASDPDHTSFGCADDRDLTYFGEAFLRDALPGAPSLEAAFDKARRLIASRERAEKLTPSNPQRFVGGAIRQKLARPE